MTDIFTPTGLVLPDDLTEERHTEIGRALVVRGDGHQWQIGDWYRAIAWGDKRAACERVGLNYDSARTYSPVCGSFEMQIRICNCSFLHHQVAAPIRPVETRQALLERAAAEGWTVARLREEIRVLKGADTPEPEPEEPANPEPRPEEERLEPSAISDALHAFASAGRDLMRLLDDDLAERGDGSPTQRTAPAEEAEALVVDSIARYFDSLRFGDGLGSSGRISHDRSHDGDFMSYEMRALASREHHYRLHFSFGWSDLAGVDPDAELARLRSELHLAELSEARLLARIDELRSTTTGEPE